MQADKDTHLVFTSLVLITHSLSTTPSWILKITLTADLHWRQCTKCVPALQAQLPVWLDWAKQMSLLSVVR